MIQTGAATEEKLTLRQNKAERAAQYDVTDARRRLTAFLTSITTAEFN